MLAVKSKKRISLIDSSSFFLREDSTGKWDMQQGRSSDLPYIKIIYAI